jgi:hypothetical protein
VGKLVVVLPAGHPLARKKATMPLLVQLPYVPTNDPSWACRTGFTPVEALASWHLRLVH